MVFWELLQNRNPEIFDNEVTHQISLQLQEADFACTRDLFKKLKEIVCAEDADKTLSLYSDGLIELSDYIDEVFELVLTDNALSR